MGRLNGVSLATEEQALHRLLVDSSIGGLPLDREKVKELVSRRSPLLPPRLQSELTDRLMARMSGLGPLEPLFEDPSVTDIMVNGSGEVWIEVSGALQRTDVEVSPATLVRLIEQIVSPLGLRADRSVPLVDARLPDGSRVNVAMPPVAVDGPYLSIRRFRKRRWALSDFASGGVSKFLAWAVRARANVLFSGGTSAGKSTLLNTMAGEIPPGDRIVTVEDAAELALNYEHVVRLETRSSAVEGLSPVTVRDLVRNALRMRPDRILLGEVRGAEAFDLLQAMNTGHDGCMSTCHANGAGDALRRLESMALMADGGLPLPALREQIASALDFVVHLARGPSAQRQVVEVVEVSRSNSTALATAPPLVDDGKLLRLPSFSGRVAPTPEPSARWLEN